jgi:hypothetical protein
MDVYLCVVLGIKKWSQHGYILGELERSFEGMRTNRYQARLIINRK